MGKSVLGIQITVGWGGGTEEGRLEEGKIWLLWNMEMTVAMGKITRRGKLHQHSVQQQALFICSNILVRGVL